MAEYITKKAAIKAVENAPIELFQSEWEEIEEAIQTVAGMATVQACPKYALHAALWWLAVKSKEVER